MGRLGQEPEPRGQWQQELRAGAIALGAPLGAQAVASFEAYLEELQRWQVRANLSGFRSPRAIVRGGFLDSLACLKALPDRPLHVVDIGSGAGFPALPLRIVRSDLSVTLVEANRRRHSFLAHLCRRLGLSDVRCLHGRAEALVRDPALAGAFDVAFARAVQKLPAAAALAAGFLRRGGVFVGQQPAAAAQAPPSIPGYGPCSPVLAPSVGPPARALLIYPRSG